MIEIIANVSQEDFEAFTVAQVAKLSKQDGKHEILFDFHGQGAYTVAETKDGLLRIHVAAAESEQDNPLIRWLLKK